MTPLGVAESFESGASANSATLALGSKWDRQSVYALCAVPASGAESASMTVSMTKLCPKGAKTHRNLASFLLGGTGGSISVKLGKLPYPFTEILFRSTEILFRSNAIA